MCDRVAIMDYGKILTVDTPAGLIEKHKNDPNVRIFAPVCPGPARPLDHFRHDLRAHLPMVPRRDSGDAPIRRDEPIELEQRHVVGAGGERRLLGRFRGHWHPLVPVGGPADPSPLLARASWWNFRTTQSGSDDAARYV